MRKVLALGLLLGGMFVSTGAVELVFFFDKGCIHCSRVDEFLTQLQKFYRDLEILRYDVQGQGNWALLSKLLAVYKAELGPVPMVFVGEVAMIGSTFYGLQPQPAEARTNLVQERWLEEAILRAQETQAPSPLTRLPPTATEALLFISPGDCPGCQLLQDLLALYMTQWPNLGLKSYVLGEGESQALLEKLSRLYRVPAKGPALFVGEVAVAGDRLYPSRGGALAFPSLEGNRALEQAVGQAVESRAVSPLEKLRLREKLTIGAVVAGAALDSINPCDFAVLVLLLGTLLVMGKRMKVIWAGLAFAAGIFVAYFALGFVLYSLLGLTVGTRAFREPFILGVSSLAILVGLWQMKDLLWYGKWFSIEVPESWKPTVKKLTASVVSVPGAFVIGLVDSLFLAPCTSGPYIVILTLLSQTTTRWQGAGLLLLYNFIFILPMVAITFLVHFGMTTTARAERWRQAKLGKLHFATGLVMLLLGVGMIVGVRLGWL